MDAKKIENYAHLIAKIGGAVKKRQEVVILSEVETVSFANKVAKYCYECGASRVSIEYSNPELGKLSYEYADEEKLSTLNQKDIGNQEYLNAVLPVMIYLISEDPDGLSGIDQGRDRKVPREARKPLPVVHCRGTGQGLGRKGLPRP